MRKFWTGCACVAAAVAIATAGCKKDEGITAAERELIDQANSGMTLTEEVVTAAVDAIVQDGTGGSIGEKAEAPTQPVSFTGTVDLTVDFDAVDGLGNDLFPNLSGELQVQATGSVEGTQTAGNVSYAVDVTRTTDIVLTNPNPLGKWTQAVAAAGQGISLTLDIVWTGGDDLANCSLTVDFTASRTGASALPIDLTLADGATVVVATLDEAIVKSLALGATGGVGFFSASISGHRQVDWTVDTESHSVRVEVDFEFSISGLGGTETESSTVDSITVTVDGTVFGPYTLLQFWLAILFAA